MRSKLQVRLEVITKQAERFNQAIKREWRKETPNKAIIMLYRKKAETAETIQFGIMGLISSSR